MNIPPSLILAVIIATATIIKETLDSEEQLFQNYKKLLNQKKKHSLTKNVKPNQMTKKDNSCQKI